VTPQDLLERADLVVTLRETVHLATDTQWVDLERILHEGYDLITAIEGQDEDSLGILPEIRLVEAFTSFHRCRQLLRDAVMSGGAAGVPHLIDTSTVEVLPLEAAIAASAAPGLETVRGQSASDNEAYQFTLLDSLAQWLLAVRRALLTEEWEAALTHAEGWLAHARQRPAVTVWPEIEETELHLHLTCTALAHKILLARCQTALTAPWVGSGPGAAGLTDALASAKAAAEFGERYGYGVRDEEARVLHESAALVARLREGMQREDVEGLAVILQEAQERDISPLAAGEVATVKRFVQDKRAIQKLGEALSLAPLHGRPGALSTEHLALDSVQRALHEAAVVVDKSQQMRTTIAMTEAVLAVRRGFCDDDLEAVDRGLQAWEASAGQAGRYLSPEVRLALQQEERLARSEAFARHFITRFRLYATEGATRGKVGALLTQGVRYQELEELIRDYERNKDHLEMTDAVSALVTSCATLSGLRRGILHRQWEKVVTHLDDALLDAHLPLYRPEVDLLRDEYDNYVAQKALRLALASGGAEGTAGSLDRSPILLADLDDAIVGAERLQTRAERTVQMAGLARQVLALRRLLSAPTVGAVDWAGVREVLSAVNALGLPPEVTALTASEVALVSEEAEAVLLRETALRALANGRATGETSQLDTSSLRVGELDDAIRLVGEKAPRVAEVLALRDVAAAIRRLRAALSRAYAPGSGEGDWVLVREALTGAQGLATRYEEWAVVVEAVGPELEQVEREVLVHDARTRIEEALQVGSWSGHTSRILEKVLQARCGDEGDVSNDDDDHEKGDDGDHARNLDNAVLHTGGHPRL
jgi:hypothetical protein